MAQTENLTAIPDQPASRLFPIPRLSTLVTVAVVVFLIWAFFSGLSMQFYASFLFLFYAATKSMWVSVVLLGVFQTLIMIPFRVVNLIKSANLSDFKKTVEKVAVEEEAEYFLKREVGRGERVALYYVVNFVFSLVSYVSIGRLFLTDFYQNNLDPNLLYSFVPYPSYPLADRWFKLPYLWFTETIDLGPQAVKWAWGVVLLLQLVVYAVLFFSKRAQAKQKQATARLGRAEYYATGNLVLFLGASWYLLRHLPVNWELRIFSGDVSVPNRTLNTITALATFFTLVWTNLPKIQKKVALAEAAGFEPTIIKRTQKDLLRETFFVATMVGLGAFYITNLIPSAFELSIFTLEIISWTAPLTLDRVILRTTGDKKAAAGKDKKSDEEKEKKPGKKDGSEKDKKTTEGA